MKIGMRKPSIKKSISARTTGRVKRKVEALNTDLVCDAINTAMRTLPLGGVSNLFE